nr:hypothetical protein Iba_chr10aCG9270 [Ipomoea batatas]GMD46784.1 hypothetical protein Iba_chr10eCG6650 [Ipomoea batatas]GMD88674.1 hypothetical protein Iba_scaffold384665CG0010 [Ipomoea batatas]
MRSADKSPQEKRGQKPTGTNQEKFVLPDLKICSDEKRGLLAANQSPKYNFKHIGIIREEVTRKSLPEKMMKSPCRKNFVGLLFDPTNQCLLLEWLNNPKSASGPPL